MNTEMERKEAGCRAFKLAIHASVLLLAAGGLQAANLWTNGAVTTGINADNRCDSGPNLCGNMGGAMWTVFDNFNIPASSKTWVVSGFDFSDFLVNGPTSDYKSTNWSIWNGDPLSGGKLVGSGSATASLALVTGSCGLGSTCLQTFTVNLTSNLVLLAGNTYYLGTSNILSPTNGNEATLRAFAAGGNTAPGGTANVLSRWEQSNGTTTGVVNSAWSAGPNDRTFPGSDLNIPEAATAFDIQGTLAPEPGTISMLGLALAGCYFYLRRRTA